MISYLKISDTTQKIFKKFLIEYKSVIGKTYKYIIKFI